LEKRHQVFVSSTYADLKAERRSIIQTLLEMDCIPAGMELFPAADEEQFVFIKKIIDDCDYYLLVIGGRYGALTPSGISYTEQEYDYAKSRNLQVIALLHEHPGTIPLEKSEGDPELRRRLDVFRQKVSQGRLVRHWNNASELPGMVALSLSKTIKAHPARGWIRADRIASEELLAEINDVRKRNDELVRELDDLRSAPLPKVQNLAGLDEHMLLAGNYWNNGSSNNEWNAKLTWGEIFAAVAPYLAGQPLAAKVKEVIALAGFSESSKRGTSPELDDQVFQTISVQLQALSLIELDVKTGANGRPLLFWTITSAGQRLMLELRTVKSSVQTT